MGIIDSLIQEYTTERDKELKEHDSYCRHKLEEFLQEYLGVETGPLSENLYTIEGIQFRVMADPVVHEWGRIGSGISEVHGWDYPYLEFKGMYGWVRVYDRTDLARKLSEENERAGRIYDLNRPT